MSFYAVRIGRTPGIYNNWPETNEQIHKFNGAKYKKFKTKEDAQLFVNGEDIPNNSKTKNSKTNNSKTNKSNNPNKNISIDITPKKMKNVSSNIRIVYTDGATSNNQYYKQGKSRGGCGVYYGFDTVDNLSIPYIENPTNNKCELKAILFALIQNMTFLTGATNDSNKRTLKIFTDSLYSIQVCNKVLNNPPSPSMPNYDLLILIYHYILTIKKTSRYHVSIEFNHIKAHTNNNDIHSLGNKGADEHAVRGILRD